MGQTLTINPADYEQYDSLRICYTYTDENGCRGTADMTITIEGSTNLNLPDTRELCNTDFDFDLGGLPEPPGTSGTWTSLDGSDGIINDSLFNPCLLYTSPSPRDLSTSRMPSSA